MPVITRNIATNLVVVGVIMFFVCILDATGVLYSQFEIELGSLLRLIPATLGIFSFLAGIGALIKISKHPPESDMETISEVSFFDLSKFSKSKHIKLACIVFIVFYPVLLNTFFYLEKQEKDFEIFALVIGVIIPLLGWRYARKLEEMHSVKR